MGEGTGDGADAPDGTGTGVRARVGEGTGDGAGVRDGTGEGAALGAEVRDGTGEGAALGAEVRDGTGDGVAEPLVPDTAESSPARAGWLPAPAATASPVPPASRAATGTPSQAIARLLGVLNLTSSSGRPGWAGGRGRYLRGERLVAWRPGEICDAQVPAVRGPNWPRVGGRDGAGKATREAH